LEGKHVRGKICGEAKVDGPIQCVPQSNAGNRLKRYGEGMLRGENQWKTRIKKINRREAQDGRGETNHWVKKREDVERGEKDLRKGKVRGGQKGKK